MTSQEKIENADLIEEAKTLGIKCPHACGVETLKRKVEEAKAGGEQEAPPTPVEQPRKKAPKMVIANINEDTRERVVAEMRAKEPDCEFLFQRSDVTDQELAAKGMERTGIPVGNDTLVRTDKEGFGKWMAAQNDSELSKMRSIEKENGGQGQIVRTLTETKV